jgi:nucleoid-associated protein YgaU
VACPVCGERFPEPPGRCFRCETDLGRWWPLDASLQALAAAATPRPAPASSDGVAPWAPRLRAMMGPALLIGGLLGAVLLHLETTQPPVAPLTAPVPARPARPLPAPDAPPDPASTVRYVVQRGDSLWRIAAALQGDGARWPELVVGDDAIDPERLVPGQELRLRLAPRPR